MTKLQTGSCAGTAVCSEWPKYVQPTKKVTIQYLQQLFNKIYTTKKVTVQHLKQIHNITTLQREPSAMFKQNM